MCECSNSESIDQYQERLKAKFEEFVAGLEKEPPVDCQFKPGDVVTFTNEYGISFPGHIVLGFHEDTEFYGRFIYIAYPGERAYNGCAYWFPHKPEELTPATTETTNTTGNQTCTQHTTQMETSSEPS